MKRTIKKAAVLGSGVMGSKIACHLANVGIEVLLLDIIPKEAVDSESASARNALVDGSLKKAIKSKPAPLYKKDFASRITTGNFEDDLSGISESDWIIEAVIERAEIKAALYEKVEMHRKKGTLISSNTSGIPIKFLTRGRSEDFVRHFCGTHFFNPPRYLRLLEIIPGPDSDPAVIEFFMNFGRKVLGKKTVLCKDTPAFIANRIGVFAVMNILNTVQSLGLGVNEVDKLTGPIIGRPKSATFRTCDVVGLDTLVKVAQGVAMSCKDDEARENYTIPPFLDSMLKQGWFGEKSGQGFYKKLKGSAGERILQEIDFSSLEYNTIEKPNLPAYNELRSIDSLRARLKACLQAPGVTGEFYRKTFFALFSYAANRIPEISEEVFRIDDAIKAGFGYELGVFEAWDAIGFKFVLDALKEEGLKVPDWIERMDEGGIHGFYKNENGKHLCYDRESASYKEIPGMSSLIILDHIKPSRVIESNPEASLIDLGDGVLNVEFHSKMNSIGAGILGMVNSAIDLAEKDFQALVIANQGQNFSAGANIGMLLMLAIEQEWEELDLAVRTFQSATMRCRYSSIPVVVAPHTLTLGGACEFTLHADKVVAAAETYIGMVEAGVGLLPAGGGTKEMARRISAGLEEGDVMLNRLSAAFTNIATAKVATSAEEAREMHYLRNSDIIVNDLEEQIAIAKSAALSMAQEGYRQKPQDKNIKVLGRSAIALFKAGINGMKMGRYISEHDALIADKIAYVIAGGDLSYPQEVSEQYLLDLEREGFLSLCGHQKTLERLQHTIQTGKPLRN